MRKKWMKNAAAALLTALMGAALLTGCSGMESAVQEASENKDESQQQEGTDVPQPEETEEETASTEPDTVRWFNASYAILTELNGCDYNMFGGMEASEINKQAVQQMLESSWDVTDRASADETLDWILTEGHRTGFVDDNKSLEEYGIAGMEHEEKVSMLTESIDGLTTDQAELYVDWYEMYEQYGEQAIDGWDYCRALNLMSFYYIAGYYTEEEALDKSLEIAQTLQPLFGSWDELTDSYLRGYEYWAEESSDERRQVYESLKQKDDSPYKVDYNTTLEKTW